MEVSGPTIDNRYPADSLRFGVGEREICNPYSAGVSPDGESGPDRVPVTIRAVEIVGQEPSGAPVFTVIPVKDRTTCLVDEAEFRIVGDCVGATLPADSGATEPVCVLGLAFSGTTEYEATVRFDVEATCTDTEASPCNTEEVRALAPTPAAPVIVHWSTSVGPLTGCPEDPEGEGSGDCPGNADDD